MTDFLDWSIFKYGEEYQVSIHGKTYSAIYTGRYVIGDYHGGGEIPFMLVFKISEFYAYPKSGGDRSAFASVIKGESELVIAPTREDLVTHLRYIGSDYDLIKVGDRNLAREEFILEAASAGVKREDIETSLERGGFSQSYSGGGEIKVCPSCNKIRQTSCCACGCGRCSVCGYRWVCSPIFPVQLDVGERTFLPSSLAGVTGTSGGYEDVTETLE